jgi:ethanolamine ammonia-lyase small subunit
MDEQTFETLPEPAATRLLQAVRANTPARLLVGRGGLSYRTSTLLDLRLDHAAARDAVRRELQLASDFAPQFRQRWDLFLVSTRAGTKEEYLLRPDLGRSLDDEGRRLIRERCPARAELQVVLGDGLSVDALAVQAPPLLPLLKDEATRRGWSFGRPFVVRHARVGILNEIGALLEPVIAVLLIGERPGLATAESLSAYLAYQPRPGDTDARRNLISNIHAQGVAIGEAAVRIGRMAERMRAEQQSGVAIKECLDVPTLLGPPADQS